MFRRKFFLEREPMRDSVALHIGERDDNDKFWKIAQPITFVENTLQIHTEPCLYITNEECQSLMDELWPVGFRPSEGTGSAGALKATQNHLDDMRKIVFKMLKM